MPGRITPADDSGTSFHAPARSPRGSETTNRVSSPKLRRTSSRGGSGAASTRPWRRTATGSAVRSSSEKPRRSRRRGGDGHLHRVLDPVLAADLLHEADGALDGAEGVVGQPEREREEEQRLVVGRSLDVGIEAGSTAIRRSRLVSWNPRSAPLCIHSHCPCRNGWQLLRCTGFRSTPGRGRTAAASGSVPRPRAGSGRSMPGRCS